MSWIFKSLISIFFILFFLFLFADWFIFATISLALLGIIMWIGFEIDMKRKH